MDEDIDSDSGSGTSGDPYGRSQYAFDNLTKGSDGTLIYIQGSRTWSSAPDHSTLGHGTGGAGIWFIQWPGETAWIWDANGQAYHLFERKDYYHIDGGEFRNSTDILIELGDKSTIMNATVHNCTSTGIYLGWNDSEHIVAGCHIYDCDEGIDGSASGGGGGVIVDNYLTNGSIRDFSTAIYEGKGVGYIGRNIISIDGASNGITQSDGHCRIDHNTIYGSGSGTGKGIFTGYSGTRHHQVTNNLVSGFGGTGGTGITNSGTSEVNYSAYNAVSDCTTKYDYVNNSPRYQGSDDEELSVEVFEKSGSDTFANRFAYFAPKDAGNLWRGSSSGNLDKGAVQHADPAGGGGSTTVVLRARPVNVIQKQVYTRRPPIVNTTQLTSTNIVTRPRPYMVRPLTVHRTTKTFVTPAAQVVNTVISRPIRIM